MKSIKTSLEELISLRAQVPADFEESGEDRDKYDELCDLAKEIKKKIITNVELLDIDSC